MTMLHSRSIQNQKLSLFASMLESLINGNTHYEQLLFPVINDAYELSRGIKNYYTINRDEYPVIVYLVKNDKEYFQKLDIKNIKQDNYQHILSSLKNNTSQISA